MNQNELDNNAVAQRFLMQQRGSGESNWNDPQRLVANKQLALQRIPELYYILTQLLPQLFHQHRQLLQSL